MGRVINTDSPGKRRNYHRRTVAEVLRQLSQKTTLEFSEDEQDMLAAIVYALRGMHDTIEESVTAWEKRGYWMKAERFQREWQWTRESAYNLEDVLRHEAWDLVPELLLQLFGRFGDIQVKTLTRKPDVWHGDYAQLLAEEPSPAPY